MQNENEVPQTPSGVTRLCQARCPAGTLGRRFWAWAPPGRRKASLESPRPAPLADVKAAGLREKWRAHGDPEAHSPPTLHVKTSLFPFPSADPVLSATRLSTVS